MYGYFHPNYINSYVSLDKQIILNECKGTLIKRKIPLTNYTDLCGAHPLFYCKNHSNIKSDFKSLSKEGHVSLVFVSDQINMDNYHLLNEEFTVCRPFKQHYITSLDKPWESFVRRSMKRYANKAFSNFKIDLVDDNSKYSDILWRLLVNNLQHNHNVKPHMLSKSILEKQLSVPGVRLFKASINGEVHGVACYVEVGSKVYGHIIGSSDFGRKHHVMYGLYGIALNHYHKKMKSIDFGSNAGLKNDPKSGLSLFKSGWSNRKQTVYLCGKILNSKLYEQLVYKNKAEKSPYFPAYRNPKQSEI